MNAGTRIAVAGATGRLGSHIVDVLEERGYEVVRISRTDGVDVVTGEGLAEALAGVDTAIDAAAYPSNEQEPATEFFVASAQNLQELGAAAGVRQLVVVSIIGIDHFTAGFLAAKKVHEQEVVKGPLPVRLLRAAQFHEFVEPLLGWIPQENGVKHVPNMLACRRMRPWSRPRDPGRVTMPETGPHTRRARRRSWSRLPAAQRRTR